MPLLTQIDPGSIQQALLILLKKLLAWDRKAEILTCEQQDTVILEHGCGSKVPLKLF